MKRRTWNTLRGLGGDEESAIIAQALASVADADTLRSLLDVLTALDRFGGEALIAAYRYKFDAHGNRVAPEEVGDYRTAGFLFSWDPVAKATRPATAAPVEPDQGLDGELPLMEPESLETEDEPEDVPAEPVAA